LVLWQQQKPTTTSFGSIVGRERIARLLLTKGSRRFPPKFPLRIFKFEWSYERGVPLEG